MPVLKDDPTTKCTIFLYDKDTEEMKRRYGYGWSARIRVIVHDYLAKTATKRDSDAA